MKHRNRHSALVFLSLMLVVALLAGISPASYAAPLQTGASTAGSAPTIADKAAEAGIAQAVPAEEEVSLKDKLMKYMDQQDAPADEAAEEALPEEAAQPEEMAQPEVAVRPGETVHPKETARPDPVEVAIEAVRAANDPDALMAKYGGYGYYQTVYTDLFEDSDYAWYAGDGYIYCEFPEQSYDWDSYDWDGFDWDAFDWSLIEDWDDWADFGSADWDGYNSWDGFDGYGYQPQIGMLITDKNVYQLERHDDGEEYFSVVWEAIPDDGAASSNLEEYPLRLLFDSPLFEITDVRFEGGLLAVTMTESPFAFEDDVYFGGHPGQDDVLGYEYAWADGTYQWVYYLDPDTLEVQYYEEQELMPTGEPLVLYSRTVFYDEPESDLFYETLEKAVPYELGRYRNPRTVTVIYDPGTEMEETVSCTAEKGDFLTTYFKEGYSLYEDAYGIIPFRGSDAMRDYTLYALSEISWDDGWDYGNEAWFGAESVDALPAEKDSSNEAYGDEPWPGAESADSLPTQKDSSENGWDYGYEPWFSAESFDALPAEKDSCDADCGSDCACDFNCGCNMDIEGPFEEGPVADTQNEAEPVEDAEAAEIIHHHVLIVASTEDEPGVVILNPYTSDDTADTVDETQEEAVILLPEEETLDYAETSDRIYAANKLDNIFQNHASVQYCATFDQDKNPGRFAFIYETPDMAYRENRDAAFYATNDSFYQLWLDDDQSDLYYTFDFVNGYDPILNAGYEIVPATLKEWWNPAHETPVDAYLSDGMIYLESVYDEDMSRSFMDSWVKEAYDGQTVSIKLIADAETYEIHSLIYTLVDSDGQKVSSPLIFSVDYDAAEPRACRTLRAAAERSAELTADLTIVMNPGTDREVTESMTVPVGSTVIYVTNEDTTLYEDAECTVPAARWDKLSDMTWYLVSGEAM